MANKLKKSTIPKPVEAENETKAVSKPATRPKSSSVPFKKDKEETLEFKKLARDERTWKIIGTLSLLVSIFLFIAFVSYFFTWKEDQDKVINNGTKFLWDEGAKATNLLGRLGAYTSDFFIWKGFGIASFLFCTFFFVLGINLLFNRKVFSILRNLKYVTFGLLIASVTFAFVFASAEFQYGGLVGKMICDWLINFLGVVGTAALLLVVGISYLIWQFNPNFNMPETKEVTPLTADTPDISEISEIEKKTNLLRGEGGMIVNSSDEDLQNEFSLVEKEDELFEEEAPVEKGVINELMHQDDLMNTNEVRLQIDESLYASKKQTNQPVEDLPLEIKTVEKSLEEEEVKGAGDLTPYEPTLDLRDYKYPTIELLETHGSEKIVQDPGELEANKNQIINTLKNYDITIQKISATVGPTVTLYEIVPAAGVRISRIKNLEDDIALSLAALGIRIIAPIPGKGTIGIEVPNHKKSVVSMKTLLLPKKTAVK